MALIYDLCYIATPDIVGDLVYGNSSFLYKMA
jgi:hypothetical protein